MRRSLLVVLFFAVPALAGTFNALAPRDFVRTTATPAPEVVTFAVKNPLVEYHLRFANGGASGTLPKVTSAVVKMNGTQILGASDFNAKTPAVIDKVVTLAKANQLSVELRGDPGATATVSVTGIDNDPPTINATVTPPANAAGWNSDAVTVSFVCDDPTSGVAVCPAPIVVQTDGVQTISGKAVDLAGNTATASVTVKIDTSAPVAAVVSPASSALVNTASVVISGNVSDNGSGVTQVLCGTAAATLANGDFTCTAQLIEGHNLVDIASTDVAGNQAHVLFPITLDTAPPQLSGVQPSGGTTNAASVAVTGTAADASGIRAVTVNGAAATVDASGSFSGTAELTDGANTIDIAATDAAGNVTHASASITRYLVPTVVIDAPADLAVVGSAAINVQGKVTNAAQVDVNGIPAALSGDTFSVSGVPLAQGRTVLTATARTASGHVAAQSVIVYRDSIPPKLVIDYPTEGATVYAPSITVSGMVDDIAVGTVNASQASVTVNNVPATVANRAFVADAVTLAPGANTLTITAVDQGGNSVSVTRHVTYDNASHQPRIAVAGGDRQTGDIAAELPQPISARLTTAAGAPAANQTVTFRVVENNGTLKSGNEIARVITATTGANGVASAIWTLGTHSGAGNEVVEATAPGFTGLARFTAIARTAAPALVVVDAGSNQFGIVGEPLPRPLVAVVTDAGSNRIGGVPVTFSVVDGGGVFPNGQPSITVTTDSDGRAWVTPALGPSAGNNVFSATVEGVTTDAAFTATGRVSGPAEETKISGVVLDNTNTPIAGVTVRVEGSTLTTRADAQGQFTIAPAPVGYVKLLVDGTTAQRTGTWPTLEFTLFTLPGQNNTVGMPIYLLPIDNRRGLFVDETTGGTLTLPELPGFSITVKPGSVTFPGGSRTGTISATLVHSDKVPMAPGFGQQPRFIVTIQPVGAHFDPPAAITFPNVDGLAPGEVTEMYSFDHDLGQFVAIGTGTVSDDGSVLRSDPGVGIMKAGWHCGGNPSASGTAHKCPECKKCMNHVCIPDYGADPTRCCKGERYNSAAFCCDKVEGPQPKNPIKNLDLCPGKVALPGYKPVIDGCTNVPNNPMETFPGHPPDGITCAEKKQAPSFFPPCAAHDVCYQTCNSDRDACDQLLGRKIRDLCEVLTDPWCQIECYKWANTYETGVAVLAEGAYKDDQKKACQCCP
jgi:Glucodextranase, domain B/Carboxypeptidase regulatory-like domain